MKVSLHSQLPASFGGIGDKGVPVFVANENDS